LKPEEVTQQILAAWDEIVEEEEGTPPPEASTVEEDDDRDQEETPEEAEESEEDQDDAGDDDAEQEDEEESEEEEADDAQAAEPTHQYEDIEIQAFLSKYGGDVEKALKGAAEAQRLLGRRDDERTALAQRVQELQQAMAQQQAFGSTPGMLTEEQQVWVEAAAESPQPGMFVQQAIQAGEFELARAVCREWAGTNPYEASRVGQAVDAIEFQARQQQAQPQQIPPATTWQALADNYPELRNYENQMVETLERLGPEHPLTQEARSTDPAVAVRGIFGIYEIAKASTFSLTEAKNGVKKRRRQEADAAIDNAAVTSGAAKPSSAAETPRRRTPLMPGLSQEDFDSAFEAEFARQ